MPSVGNPLSPTLKAPASHDDYATSRTRIDLPCGPSSALCRRSSAMRDDTLIHEMMSRKPCQARHFGASPEPGPSTTPHHSPSPSKPSLPRSGGEDSLSYRHFFARRSSDALSLAQADVLSPGDRLGDGLRHDGCIMRLAAPPSDQVSQSRGHGVIRTPLEVVRKLGQGDHASVYLVRELPPQQSRRDEGSPGSMLQGQSNLEPGSVTPASQQRSVLPTQRRFALKCLCKDELQPEEVVQLMEELVVHSSVPAHPNIIGLHCAYETVNWLFFMFDYCLGQDIYYWLEQVNDGIPPSLVSNPVDQEADEDSAPDLSLLATTSGFGILSWHRLRLISRIFVQMCKAVNFCHEHGVAHRDLKLESFIVEDSRLLSPSPEQVIVQHPAPDAVTVKLIDFGLATRETLCIDFNCGSKPYMSYGAYCYLNHALRTC